MTHPGWGALSEEPSCGREGCFVHRLNNEVVQGKWYDKMFRTVVRGNYTVAETIKLEAAFHGMG